MWTQCIVNIRESCQFGRLGRLISVVTDSTLSLPARIHIPLYLYHSIGICVFACVHIHTYMCVYTTHAHAHTRSTQHTAHSTYHLTRCYGEGRGASPRPPPVPSHWHKKFKHTFNVRLTHLTNFHKHIHYLASRMTFRPLSPDKQVSFVPLQRCFV